MTRHRHPNNGGPLATPASGPLPRYPPPVGKTGEWSQAASKAVAGHTAQSSILWSSAHHVRARSGPDSPASCAAIPTGTTACSAGVNPTRRCPIRVGDHHHHSRPPPTPLSARTAATSATAGASTSSPRLDQTDTETCHTGAPSLSRAQRSTARIVRTRSPVACRLSRVYGRSARGSLSARAHHSPLSGFHVPGSVHMNPPALPADFRTRPHTAGSRHTPRRRCRSNPDKLENVSWQPAQWHAPARVHRAPHEWVMTTITAPARCSRPPPPGYP